MPHQRGRCLEGGLGAVTMVLLIACATPGIAAVSGLLLAIVACVIPASRASAISPPAALRAE